MKVEIEILEGPASPRSSVCVSPSPSLRLPVTAANRSLLRRLRAAESSAWEAGHLLHYRWPGNESASQESRHF